MMNSAMAVPPRRRSLRIIDRRGLRRNRSNTARGHPTCPPTPVAMDIKEINSKVTVSNQLEFFIGGLRDD
jgi:hypothetical protein